MSDLRPPSYDNIGGDISVSSSYIPTDFKSDIDFTGPSLSCTNPGYQPDEVLVRPPTAPISENIPHERPPLINLGSISAEEIREACIQYVSEHCCYGKKFVRETALTEIKNRSTFHYRLETFGERRETTQKTAPFKGQQIDGPENGPPPNPWDIHVPIPAVFADGKRTKEVPHTAYVKECWNCVGNCRVRCESCSGMGGNHCGFCSGNGRNGASPCTSCHGTGRRRCSHCTGTGQVKCKTCDGRGRLKHFILLIITWKNHVSDFISDTSKLPKEKIMEVNGRELLKEQQPKVYPINHCPDPLVNMASEALIQKHLVSFPNEMVRMQRHVLRAIPLTEVKYQWKQKIGEFYVFGFQNKVYFENYPQKCCCCTIC